ncbi:MAG: hypothetical protein Q8Q85_04300 [Gemmatimonadales bacterium]|nr:hypothetical protein [Gemmatimonadales bacterium]
MTRSRIALALAAGASLAATGAAAQVRFVFYERGAMRIPDTRRPLVSK